MTAKPESSQKSRQARAVASQILSKVLSERQSLSTLIPTELTVLADLREQAFAQALCYGVLRHYYSLDFILGKLLDKKLKKKDGDIRALMLIGLYQLDHMRTPAHAAVSATVDSCTTLKKPWAKNLINAILRRYQREHEQFPDLIAGNESARYEHPEWLLNMLKDEYPDRWSTIISENNLPPPMSLRVNSRVIDRARYLKQLESAGIEAQASEFNENGIVLTHPTNVETLPGFSEGHVSVQDLAAQLAIPLLEPQAGERILDACSAPGGKLAHLLESMPTLQEAVAIELEPHRFKKLLSTLDRIRLSATLIQNDVRAANDWWDKQHFDRILIDAPCSASGVVRRHPDIKYLRTPEDVQNITLLQTEILNALWPLLKKGGKLLYITCSVFSAENDEQITAFINRHNDANSIPIQASWGKATKYGRQILPGENAMDGFYYAQLQKI
ncbi:MAG: 16S rRNA (cytosine(967)-C(5))-methyltransferase RsmB [Gammaproteobacteria bacterium]